jgi:hypothetical protein
MCATRASKDEGAARAEKPEPNARQTKMTVIMTASARPTATPFVKDTVFSFSGKFRPLYFRGRFAPAAKNAL